MTTTDIYGFEQEDLGVARVAVEKALGVRLEAHDRAYLGEYYRCTLPSGPALKLRRNVDPMHQEGSDPPEERFAEPEFAGAALLLYVSGLGVDEVREILQRRVPSIAFLRRKEVA